jgi:hypothetical protein
MHKKNKISSNAQLLPILCESTHAFSRLIDRDYVKTGKELPVKELFGRLVLDQIARGGFSIDLDIFNSDSRKQEENEFVKQTKRAFNSKAMGLKMALFGTCINSSQVKK